MSNATNGILNNETDVRLTSDSDLGVGVYSGGTISVGDVLAKHVSELSIDMLSHAATKDGAHHAGKAHATFSRDNEGRVRMHLDWQWLTGDQSTGQSEWILVDSAT